MRTAEEWVTWAYENHDPDMDDAIPRQRVIAAAQAEARAAALEEAAQVIDRVLAPPKRKEKYRILAGLIRALAARDPKPEGT